MDPQKAIAIPLSELEGRLRGSLLSPASIRALLREPEFQAIVTRNDQLVFLHEYAMTQCTTSLNNEALGRIFGISKGNVAKIRCEARKPKEIRGRPELFETDQEKPVIDFIIERATQRNFASKVEVFRFAHEVLNPELSRGWLFQFFQRNADQIGFAHAVPQESSRLKVPRSYMTKYLEIIQTHVSGMNPDFVFNLDETGTSEWEESEKKTVVVPKELAGQTIHYDARREMRHQSIEVCISAGGDHLVPLAISAERKCEQAFSFGMRKSRDANLIIQRSPYINEELFFQYITNQFMPHILILRIANSSEHQRAVLIMDNLGAHCSERILKALAEKNILAISFPPHTSNIFQMLDLVTFGRMKSNLRTVSKNSRLNPSADHLVRSIRALELATIPSTVRAAFEKAGFAYVHDGTKLQLVFQEEKIRQSPDFKELWEINFPESELSPRRRASKWGVLNLEYFP